MLGLQQYGSGVLLMIVKTFCRKGNGLHTEDDDAHDKECNRGGEDWFSRDHFVTGLEVIVNAHKPGR